METEGKLAWLGRLCIRLTKQSLCMNCSLFKHQYFRLGLKGIFKQGKGFTYCQLRHCGSDDFYAITSSWPWGCGFYISFASRVR